MLQVQGKTEQMKEDEQLFKLCFLAHDDLGKCKPVVVSLQQSALKRQDLLRTYLKSKLEALGWKLHSLSWHG